MTENAASRHSGVQKGQDLVVAGLGEVVIPLPHRAQAIRLQRALDLVRLERQQVDRCGGTHRNGADHSGRTATVNTGQGGTQGCARRDTVIDDNNEAPLYRPNAHREHLDAPQHLLMSEIDLCRDGGRIQSHSVDHLVVEQWHSVDGHGSDRQFAAPRRANLGRQHASELSVESGGDRRSHHDPAAGDSEHECIGSPQVSEMSCQQTTGVGAIAICAHALERTGASTPVA